MIFVQISKFPLYVFFLAHDVTEESAVIFISYIILTPKRLAISRKSLKDL